MEPSQSNQHLGELEKLEKSYSDLAQKLHKPTNVKYALMWEFGSILQNCLPQGLGSEASWLDALRTLFRKKESKRCSATARKELGHLRRQANKQRWICWESDAAGVEVEVAMLSGRSWRFIIGDTAKGSEVKERLAELSGIHFTELSLLCDGVQVQDSEVLLVSYTVPLQKPWPQLQLLRIFRPFALSCSTDCTLKMWDLEKGTCATTLRGHGDGVMSVAVDWKSRYAVSGSHDCTLRIWDLDHGICVQAIPFAEHAAFCIEFDHGAHRILTGSWDKNVKLWDSELAVCVATFTSHTKTVKTVRLHWPSRRAISGSSDGTLKLWNLDAVDDEACVMTFEHGEEVWSADVDWGSSRVLSGAMDGSIGYWNLQTGLRLATLAGHRDAVSCVALRCSEGKALSGAWDRAIRLWDLQDAVCQAVLQNGYAVTTMSVDWVHHVALVGSQEAMKVWNIDTRICEQVLGGHLDDGPKAYSSSGSPTTPVSVGHNEAVSCLVMNSPDNFCSEAD